LEALDDDWRNWRREKRLSRRSRMRGIVTRMLSSEIVPRLDKFATVAVTGAAVGRGGSRGGRDLRRCWCILGVSSRKIRKNH